MAGDGYKGDPDTDSIPLISENFYNNMNKEHNDLSYYSNYCEGITWGKNEDQVKEICKKYIRYLETSNELKIVNPSYDVCILLNYWIYDKLAEIFKGEDSLKNIGLAFVSLQYIWSKHYYYPGKTVNYNICKPEFETDNQEDWKNRKKLYDYYVDYNYLISMANILDDKCEYYKKIKEKQAIFDYFDRPCESNSNKCPKFYHNCKSYNPKNVLATLPCHSKMGEVMPHPAAGEDASRSRALHLPEPSGEGPGLPQHLDGPQNTESTLGTSGIGKKVTHTVLGAAPIFLTATALYRYTPLGPWIRRLRGSNTNSMSAVGGVSTYMQETGDIFSDNEANYVSYQPM
ncbi:VIR protein [Plasmodium vivax]|uniref:VIR protein n=1 Tax=Plasmodium vivax TaxID=5855 RepID=A0A1G4E425_PLAVI|nr:VIR protein [Plasmodium vivax]VUZ99647.1 PIR protein [Plasmodium vivax]